MPGTLFVVATPIGNLEDITLRAVRVLREASLVAAEDTRHTGNLLRHLAIRTPLLSLHEHNEQARIEDLLGRLRAGEDVALVCDAGTPGVSDPGARLIGAAVAAGVKVTPVPGPSAVLAALTGSGIPWSTFRFVGFPPIKSKDRKKWLASVAASDDTCVAFEAPHRIRRTIGELVEFLGERPIAIGRELTKFHEEFLRGTCQEVLEQVGHPKGEFTLVISPRQEADAAHDLPGDGEIARVFGETTKNIPINRRDAIRSTAEKLGLSVKDVYQAIERHKGGQP